MELKVSTGKKETQPERNAIGHTLAGLKLAGVGTNGILECKFLSQNEHRTPAVRRRHIRILSRVGCLQRCEIMQGVV
jgi:hypothetical protein